MFQVTGLCNERLVFPVIIIERAWTRKPFRSALWPAQGGAEAPLCVSNQWLSSVNSLSSLFHDKVSHHEKSVHLPAGRTGSESRTPSRSSHGQDVHGWSRWRWFDAVIFPPVLCLSPFHSVVFQQIALFGLHMVVGPGGSLPSLLRVFVLLSFWDYPSCAIRCHVMLVYVDINSYFPYWIVSGDSLCCICISLCLWSAFGTQMYTYLKDGKWILY